MQSVNQGANDRDVSSGLQNSVQIAGALNNNNFIVQRLVQEAGVDNPDIGNVAIIYRSDQIVAESNVPEDINKFVDEFKSRINNFDIPSCNMEFPLIIEKREDKPDNPPGETDEPRAVNDVKFYGYIIILIEGEFDFGDAPNRYHTLLVSNGARHLIVPGFYLGKKIDAEVDGQPNINATGDDLNETDDEDGVTFASPLNQGGIALIDVTASAPGFLDAWMDFDGDGDWTEGGEMIISDRRLEGGVNHINVTVPAGALVGSTYSRFRFSSIRGLSFEGPAPDGEVEDYRVQIVKP